MKPCIVIPARVNSTRLPNKVLCDINGKPMIVRVFENCKKSLISDVFVATDSPEVKNAIEKIGGRAFLTNPDLPSGTDRVFECLHKNGLDDKFDIVVNVQGDVPNIEPALINQIYNLLLKFLNADIATAVIKITEKEKLSNPNVVKAVLSMKDKDSGKALYFTRALAPFGEGDVFEHVGIYAYRMKALKKFISLPPSPLEKREKLEQLRALENDMNIFAQIVDFKTISVDTEEDLIFARKMIKN